MIWLQEHGIKSQKTEGAVLKPSYTAFTFSGSTWALAVRVPFFTFARHAFNGIIYLVYALWALYVIIYRVLLTLSFVGLASHTFAEQAYVAVAANFAAPMKEISKAFESSSEHRLLVSFASSGKLYAQIKNGAPYQVFLSADQDKV